MRRSSRFSLTLMAVLGLFFAGGCSQPVATSSNPDSASPAAVEPDPTQASLKAEPTNEAESQKAKASDR